MSKIVLTEERINNASREFWNDMHSRMGGPWDEVDPGTVAYIQTKATVKALLQAALADHIIEPNELPLREAIKKRVNLSYDHGFEDGSSKDDSSHSKEISDADNVVEALLESKFTGDLVELDVAIEAYGEACVGLGMCNLDAGDSAYDLYQLVLKAKADLQDRLKGIPASEAEPALQNDVTPR